MTHIPQLFKIELINKAYLASPLKRATLKPSLYYIKKPASLEGRDFYRYAIYVSFQAHEKSSPFGLKPKK